MPRPIDFPNVSEKLSGFYRSHSRLPSIAEMRDILGYRSKGATAYLVERLIEKGIVKRDKTGRLIPTPALTGGIRLLGSIRAGFPSPAEEELLDTLSLDEFLITKPQATFLIKVVGDSMIDAGIYPGNLILVERGRTPVNGDVVVAQVDGEWTLKTYSKQGGKVILRAANKKYSDIHPKEELVIGGVVVANVRKYH